MKRISLMLGILLCILGGAGALIEFVKLPSESTLRRLQKGFPLTTAELAEHNARTQFLINWGWKDADMLKTSARIEYSMSGESPDEAKAAAYMQRAITHLAAGLALAPADPAGWFRLAYMQAKSGKPVGKALAMSVRTGPFLPYLLAKRITLALENWYALDEATQALYIEQIDLLRRYDPKEAARLSGLSEHNSQLISR